MKFPVGGTYLLCTKPNLAHCIGTKAYCLRYALRMGWKRGEYWLEFWS